MTRSRVLILPRRVDIVAGRGEERDAVFWAGRCRKGGGLECEFGVSRPQVVCSSPSESMDKGALQLENNGLELIVDGKLAQTKSRTATRPNIYPLPLHLSSLPPSARNHHNSPDDSLIIINHYSSLLDPFPFPFLTPSWSA